MKKALVVLSGGSGHEPYICNEILTKLLDNHNLAEFASNELKKTTLIFDHYYDI